MYPESASLDVLYEFASATLRLFHLSNNIFVSAPQTCQEDDVEVSVELAERTELVSEYTARAIEAVFASMKATTFFSFVVLGLQPGLKALRERRCLFFWDSLSLRTVYVDGVLVFMGIPAGAPVLTLLSFKPVSAKHFI